MLPAYRSTGGCSASRTAAEAIACCELAMYHRGFTLASMSRSTGNISKMRSGMGVGIYCLVAGAALSIGFALMPASLWMLTHHFSRTPRRLYIA